MVYDTWVPKSQLIKQTIGGTENEYLIRFGSGGFEKWKILE